MVDPALQVLRDHTTVNTKTITVSPAGAFLRLASGHVQGAATLLPR